MPTDAVMPPFARPIPSVRLSVNSAKTVREVTTRLLSDPIFNPTTIPSHKLGAHNPQSSIVHVVDVVEQRKS